MFVIIVLGLPGFAFKGSRALLTGVDWWSDSHQHPCILASLPLCHPWRRFPGSCYFRREMLCVSPSAPWLLVCWFSWPASQRGHVASSWAGHPEHIPPSPPCALRTLPSVLTAQGWPGQNSARGSFKSLFFPQAANALCPSVRATQHILSQGSIHFFSSGLAMADTT